MPERQELRRRPVPYRVPYQDSSGEGMATCDTAILDEDSNFHPAEALISLFRAFRVERDSLWRSLPGQETSRLGLDGSDASTLRT